MPAFSTAVFAARLLVLALLMGAALPAAETSVRRFTLGGPARDGFTSVAPTDVYRADPGFGYEAGQAPAANSAASLFSVNVPSGNHRVTVVLGGDRAAETTVKAESRRLMLERVATQAGEHATRTFIVNTRNAALRPPDANAPGGSTVILNDREAGSYTWDDRLTLEFTGETAAVQSVVIEPVDVPVLYLVGDSTVTDQRFEPGASWGQMITRFLRPEVAVANHAESGETLKSFLTGLRLAKVLETLKAGDWLFIEFGHNDQKKQWPQTYADADTTYRSYLRTYIAEARLRGANPVLITSVQRRDFDAQGRIRNTHGSYPDAVRAVAREENVPLIDLERASIALYEALGPSRAPLAFSNGGRDATHHNSYGAYELAKAVAQAFKQSGLPLAQFVSDDFSGYDPSAPADPSAFALPASPQRTELAPRGF
ncbi:MAG TPA: rhamnogalacturonan acetylesterase [Opitutaceae bacterium]